MFRWLTLSVIIFTLDQITKFYAVQLLTLYEQKYKQVVEGFAIEQMGRRRRDEYQSGVPRVGK